MNKKLFERCIRLSRDLAEFDDNHAQRHFSFLCLRNKIICSGINNKWRTNPLAKKFGHRFEVIHSEAAVIKACPVNWNQLPNLTLVNIRLNRNLDVMLSKPCKFCSKMLSWFEVGEVYYSLNENAWEQFI